MSLCIYKGSYIKKLNYFSLIVILDWLSFVQDFKLCSSVICAACHYCSMSFVQSVICAVCHLCSLSFVQYVICAVCHHCITFYNTYTIYICYLCLHTLLHGLTNSSTIFDGIRSIADRFLWYSLHISWTEPSFMDVRSLR